MTEHQLISRPPLFSNGKLTYVLYELKPKLNINSATVVKTFVLHGPYY